MRTLQRNLNLIWLLITIFLFFEYWALNHASAYSFLNYAKIKWPALKEMNLSTEAGRPISYYLGWAGFIVMLITNIYILRKRVGWMQKWGKVSNWLEFHIFCGLLGPTLIVFHTDFKVGGLVAISFWSMMIVAFSGIFGRYFYLQLLGESAARKKEIEKWEKRIQKVIIHSGKEISSDQVERIKAKALKYVGADSSDESTSLFGIITSSIAGDIRLFFQYPKVGGLHPQAGQVFCGYALAVRRDNFTQPFKTLLGYWHTFHVPFTIVMYITAVIHIVVALLFQVN